MNKRRGFALSELVAVIIVAAAIGSLLIIMAERSRRTARLGDDLAKLRNIGTLTRAYAADNADLLWTFSWRPGNYTTQWPDLQFASSNLDAAAKQAVAIMRERSGISNLQPVSGWIPHVLYSHLVLLDYSGESLPQTSYISSGDRLRLQWALNPQCFNTQCFPCQPSPVGSAYRWVYSSSFVLPTGFYDQSPPGGRISSSQMNFYLVPGSVDLRAFSMSDIAHPSNKAMMADRFTRHFGTRQPVYLLAEARIPVLMSDGSAGVKHSGDSNEGQNPNMWSASGSQQITYSPGGCWDPNATSPSGDFGPGRYHWTRMGVGGRDFGGPEVFP